MATKPTDDDIKQHAIEYLRSQGVTPPPSGLPEYDTRPSAYQDRLQMAMRRSKAALTAKYERDQGREDDSAARARQARADLETQLMADYVKSVPGTTDAEAKAALPDLLHRHRLAQQDRDAEARSVARYRNRI